MPCPPDVYIYTWDGSHIQVLSQQQLQLQWYNTIRAVQCVDDDRLILAVGSIGRPGINSLQAYRVSYL